MLTEEQVVRLHYIHSKLYQATKNPLYYAFVMAYENVLADDLPVGMRSTDIDELIAKWDRENNAGSVST